jgi:hypothetical protein
MKVIINDDNKEKDIKVILDYFGPKFSIKKVITKKIYKVPIDFVMDRIPEEVPFIINPFNNPIIYSDIISVYVKNLSLKYNDVFYNNNTIEYSAEESILDLDDTITIKDMSDFCNKINCSIYIYPDYMYINIRD